MQKWHGTWSSFSWQTTTCLAREPIIQYRITRTLHAYAWVLLACFDIRWLCKPIHLQIVWLKPKKIFFFSQKVINNNHQNSYKRLMQYYTRKVYIFTHELKIKIFEQYILVTVFSKLRERKNCYLRMSMGKPSRNRQEVILKAITAARQFFKKNNFPTILCAYNLYHNVWRNFLRKIAADLSMVAQRCQRWWRNLWRVLKEICMF